MNYVLGVTGGIGMGKTTASKILESWGGYRISSDEIAKELLDTDPDIRKFLTNRWGDDLYKPTGWDRPEIARRVFQDQNSIQEFNSVFHPMIRKETLKRMENSPPHRMIVWEVPLLFESKGEELCNSTICIFTDPKRAKDRAVQRGMDPIDYEKRITAQFSIEKKKSLSEFSVSNDTNREELSILLRPIWDELQKRISLNER
jgi:dephospho-CoA kinase